MHVFVSVSSGQVIYEKFPLKGRSTRNILLRLGPRLCIEDESINGKGLTLPIIVLIFKRVC